MKGRVVLFVCILATIVSAAKTTRWFQLHDYTFEDYRKEFGKQYADKQEYLFREKLFQTKLAEIHRHNKDETKTWKVGVNHLTDRTEEEYRKLLGVKKSVVYASHASRATTLDYKVYDLTDVADAVDWRQKNVVTAVKDQGMCGSCWTFGAAESVESMYAIATGQLQDFSEQQILDCTPNPQECGGTGGCQGGTAELAFARMIDMGGLSSEWTYPYISYSGNNFQCQNNTGAFKPIAKLSSYVQLPENQYDPIVNAVATAGPLVISVDASTWGVYESGVYNGCNQTNPDIDHAVLLVGYGTDPQYGDYWLVRNSWSPSWGEDGYIRLMKTSTVQCGTDINPSDGDGCQGGPPTQTVCGTCGILFDVSYPIISTN